MHLVLFGGLYYKLHSPKGTIRQMGVPKSRPQSQQPGLGGLDGGSQRTESFFMFCIHTCIPHMKF